MTRSEKALREEIFRWLQARGWKSATSPTIDLLMEWTVTRFPQVLEPPEPDVVQRGRK